jgi:hypothetical protein
MTVHVQWDDPDHTTLLYTLEGMWTWDEVFEAADKGVAMSANVSRGIYVIVNYRSTQGLPPKAFAQFNRIIRLMNAQTELVVVAGGGTLFLSLFNLFLLIAGNMASKYCWVSDLDKAYAMIAARRVPSLN